MLPNGWEWIVILAIVLLIWGAPKLPGLAKSIAQSMRIFRKEIKKTEAEPEASKSDADKEGDNKQA